MTDDLLNDRYGRRARPAWQFPLVAAALIAVAVAWSIWAALDRVEQPISAQLYGYEVAGDQRVELTVEVARSNGGAAVCTVFAQAEDKAIVGEREIDVPDSDEPVVRVSTVVETERKAVAGVLESCVLAETVP